MLEELGLGVLAHVVGDLEVAVGAGALGVDDALRNSFAVEVRNLVDQVGVAQHDGAVLAGGD